MVEDNARRFHRAVVAGGAGFLGSHLCERLIESGTEVISLDNFVTGGESNIAHLRSSRRFQQIRWDVTDPWEAPEAVDLVLHFASPASPVDYLRLPIETLRAGSIGTQNMLDLAHRKNARFVLASTSEVYGDPLVHPQREDYYGNVNPVGTRSVYDEAKRYAEALTTAYRASKGADTAIARIFNTFGPRMRPDDGRAVPTFIRQSLAGEPLTVAGDGRQTRSLCYVDDTVAGVLALAASDHPGPVNLGNTEETSILSLAHRIAALAGSELKIRFTERPVDDPEVRRPDTTLATTLLGWKPQVATDEGLEHTLSWFARRLSSESGPT